MTRSDLRKNMLAGTLSLAAAWAIFKLSRTPAWAEPAFNVLVGIGLFLILIRVIAPIIFTALRAISTHKMNENFDAHVLAKHFYVKD